MRVSKKNGFTLIELSIVLVIIGLIVGGVLVGQDLIRAAYVRAQISQIERFNTATNTFFGKFQMLPGDINNSVASVAGLTPRGTDCGGAACNGEGDGNGLLEGYNSGGNGRYVGSGETGMFWVDLTSANGLNLNLIDGSFNAASINNALTLSGSGLARYMPAAKIGGGNYIYVWSYNGINYYGMAVVSSISGSIIAGTTPGSTVRQAYEIDRKTDDGSPQSGRVTAQYVGNNFNPLWAVAGGSTWGPAYTTPVPGGSSTCFDNNSTNGAPQQYSTAQNGGAGLNCMLSFQFSAGD
jgi:prepilin-type N-terminal cleavage/methylation domain-containing protein